MSIEEKIEKDKYPFDKKTIGILRILNKMSMPKQGFAKVVMDNSLEWKEAYGDYSQQGANISIGRRCKRMRKDGFLIRYSYDTRSYEITPEGKRILKWVDHHEKKKGGK